MRAAPQPRLLNRGDAAKYCGVSVNHFLTHVSAPAVWIGGKRLWDVRALDRWIDTVAGVEHTPAPPAVTDDELLERLR